MLQQYYDNYKETFNVDWSLTADFVRAAYDSALFEARYETLGYVDQKRNYYDLELISARKMSDIRFDALHLYVSSEQEKERAIHFFGYEEPYRDIPEGAIVLEFINDMGGGGMFYYPDNDSDQERYSSPIHGDRAVASWFAAHLRYGIKSIDSMVVRCLFGKKDFSGSRIETRDAFVANIESNDYFGYTLLREFFENPMREMPTLEKIGTYF